ncbi:MAG: MFS transporter [Lentisphaerae bacterium]|nr:MFS transporter [Lentisphaerota bacterium]
MNARVAPIAWALCGLLFAATALSFLDRQVLSVLAPRLMEDLGFDNTVYSRVVSAFVLSYTLMFALGGWMIDRLGTVRGLAIAVGIWSLASGAHALAAGALGLGIARFFLGLGEGACFPAATKGACEWFPAEKRAFAIGLANGGSAFGAVLAPPMTAWLYGLVDWRGVFVVTAVVGLIWVAAWLAAGRFAPAPAAAAPCPPPWRAWGGLLRQPQVWRILAARALFDPVFYFYMFWIPKYLSSERGFSLEAIGDLYWIPFLVLGISNVGSGHVSDLLVRAGWTPRRARRTLLTAAAWLTPASCLVAWTPSAGWAIALMSLLTFAHGFWICNFLASVSDDFPAGSIATIVGLSGTVGGSASFLTSLAIGPVADRWSFTPVFIVCAALYPLALAVLMSGRRVRAVPSGA